MPPLVVAALYYLGAKLGQWLEFPSVPVSAFWASNAVLLAALILAPRKRWWTYWLAVLPFHFLALLPGSSPSAATIQYLLNAVEAALGAWAVQTFCTVPRRIDRPQAALVLIAFSAILAPLTTSMLMAGSFALAGLMDAFWLMTTVRTLANGFAAIALVPLVIHGLERTRVPVPFARAAEACALMLSLTVVGLVVFVYAPATPHTVPALLYAAPVPFLAWATLRFGTAAACAAALLLGGLSTWAVLNGHGPFATQDPVHSALSAVVFQVVTAIALLGLSSLLEERKSAARALRDSEARLRSLCEHNVVPTLLWRNDLQSCQVNDAFLRLTGASRADFAYGGERSAELIAWSRTVDCSRGRQVELPLGGGRCIPVSAAACRFAGGLGVALFARDLSAQRRMDAAREIAEQRYRAVLASLPEQIAILDAVGTVIETNASWTCFAEHERPRRFDHVLAGENLLTSCAAAAQAGDPSAAEQLQAVQAILDGSALCKRLQLAPTAGGQARWFDLSIERLPGEVGGAVIIRTDVTARKRAEQDGHEQQRQLIYLGRAALLGQLSGGLAHELKQPLTSILWNVQAASRLLAGAPTELTELQAILQDVERENLRAVELIQRIRDLLRSGEIRCQQVNLNTLVVEALQLVHCELVALRVSVTTELDGRLPYGELDRVQMQQVLLNLLINACDAMAGSLPGERKLLITTQLCCGGHSIEVAVTDSGCGIAAGELEHIFEPFVTTKSQGLGLGLAICRLIAEAHHGRLWAENAADGGAILRLRLPAQP